MSHKNDNKMLSLVPFEGLFEEINKLNKNSPALVVLLDESGHITLINKEITPLDPNFNLIINYLILFQEDAKNKQNSINSEKDSSTPNKEPESSNEKNEVNANNANSEK